MKVIYASGSKQDITAGCTTYQAHVIADSAVWRDVMPLFIPDLPLKWCGKICIALRIGRLGKGISEKFALRYVSDISAVHVLDVEEGSEGAEAFHTGGLDSLIDFMVTTGQWMPFEAGMTETELKIDDKSYVYKTSTLEIPSIISSLSRNATLKSGDMVILGSTAVGLPLIPNTIINVELNTQRALHLKVK